MRGTPPGAVTPHPIVELMPAVFRDDPVLCRITAALDAVLAPAISALDCLDAYLDPALAPEDFLDWLGGWVGAPAAAGRPAERRRAAVAGAVPLYAHRGTVAGLRAQLELLAGAPVRVTDSGGVRWSRTPTEPAATAEQWLRVEPEVADPELLDLLDEVVRAAKPAHVPHHTRPA